MTEHQPNPKEFTRKMETESMKDSLDHIEGQEDRDLDRLELILTKSDMLAPLLPPVTGPVTEEQWQTQRKVMDMVFQQFQDLVMDFMYENDLPMDPDDDEEAQEKSDTQAVNRLISLTTLKEKGGMTEAEMEKWMEDRRIRVDRFTTLVKRWDTFMQTYSPQLFRPKS